MQLSRLLQFAAAFQGPAQGQFVGKFEAGASGDAVSDASNLDLVRCQAFGEIEAGGVAFHVCAQRKDDFANWFLRKAAFQLADAEVFRFDAIDWGDAASQYMEFAAVIACSLDAESVSGCP